MKISLTLLLIVIAVALAFSNDAMNPKLVDQPAFEVIGLQARTNNTKEAEMGGAIPQTWQTFYMNGDLDRIPDKLDDSVIAVYTDYASDVNGEYTFILGAKVKPGTTPPPGMVSKQVPAGKFDEFTSEQGPLQTVIPKIWRQIAEYFSAPSAPKRSYRADYEVYPSALDPNNGSAKIYVGVK